MAFSKIVMNGETLMDLTQDTVAADKLVKDYTAHGADGTAVTGTLEDAEDVIFIDYDGTVVAKKSKAAINAMTSDSDLPANPTHTGLTSQGWNWTVAQLKAQLTAMPNQIVYVGQMYVTTSGATEIDVVMQDGRLDPILTICVNGTISVNWGDNTTPDSVTGTSLTTRQVVSHTYQSAGSYTISISAVSGTYAFYGSSNLLLLRKNTSVNPSRVYASCVKAIRIGNGITNLGDYAFYFCTSLANITISSSVTSIGNGVFQGCYSLANITIPSSVTSISDNTFNSCYALTNIAIPSNVTGIGDNAFYNCYSLINVTISKSVTSIVGSAFYNCYSLTNITIPSNVTSIGSNAFYGCYALASITIPSSITSIAGYAFYSCRSLASIIIPGGVTSSASYAFYGCYALTNITIPSSVTSIGDNAFYNCYSLINVTIPSNVTSVAASAFYGCYALANITIPSNITSIGNSAFQNCYGVAEYHVKPITPPTLGTTVFKNIPSDCVIYVPQGKLSDYQSATGWADYATYMQEEPQS